MTPLTVTEATNLLLAKPFNRWSIARKMAVCTLVNEGAISFGLTLQVFELTEEELQSWLTRYSEHGAKGLTNKALAMWYGRARGVQGPRHRMAYLTKKRPAT